MTRHIRLCEIILFVSNQDQSTKFYEKLLRKQPDLNVPGMTEFILSDTVKLGLMPMDGIKRLLGDKIKHPGSKSGNPGCELYLYVDDIEKESKHALDCGAELISPVLARDWGDKTCYFADPDGYVIAFAEKVNNQNQN